MDPYILTGSWIPILWAVHGSLNSDPSVDPCILFGTWIPKFWTVRWSLKFFQNFFPKFSQKVSPSRFEKKNKIIDKNSYDLRYNLELCLKNSYKTDTIVTTVTAVTILHAAWTMLDGGLSSQFWSIKVWVSPLWSIHLSDLAGSRLGHRFNTRVWKYFRPFESLHILKVLADYRGESICRLSWKVFAYSQRSFIFYFHRLNVFMPAEAAKLPNGHFQKWEC